jgi:HAE1 family hydrophobic/amphiphilic exporter-1
MAAQFESFLDPFIIFFTIPISLIGVLLIHIATNDRMSMFTAVGVVVLVGVVVNNGIVLVDYINQLRERGTDLATAVLEGGRRRLRPVLMTAGTTVLGMLPLALELGEGAESWSPLARTVMGGLTTSTALTLLVIPLLYFSVESFREKRRARRAARQVARQEERPAEA